MSTLDSVPEETLPRPERRLQTGAVLGRRYRLMTRIGRGGMGEVWRATDQKLRLDVALKIIDPDRFGDEEGRKLLREEVRTARAVMSPNVCRVFDLVEADELELVSMELVDGITLKSIIEESSPVDLEEAQQIAVQLLSGLQEIHKSGLIHRDIKPENVMVTRTGRVVIMDFGLARSVDDHHRSISGTPPYMPVEQARGDPIDQRADVFAAGVLLAELINPEGGSSEARHRLWRDIRKNPPKVPQSPWSKALERAIARSRNLRLASAGELLLALEKATLRFTSAGNALHPYPGFSTFAEQESAYFFGREAELESVWRRLGDTPHLLGLIGPSGAGKSSFLNAGVRAHKPDGWRITMTSPGNTPFLSLARAFADEFSGDSAKLKELLQFENHRRALALITQWRRGFSGALVVIDQFEELFTLNNRDVQERFASLIGTIPLETDVHVLLAMRDDFLFECHEYESLHPVVADLMMMGPLEGTALRRAIVQPALKCGYSFEDPSLVDEIAAEVEGERGALPLMAFAMARLWEMRDRETGVLTRESLNDIGGVSGALVQYAEATLGHVGPERTTVMRELFRNLVTPEGTRVSRDRGELLSIFPAEERARVDEVLEILIHARLLTAYESDSWTGVESETSRRIEIVHESLLTTWPRLVQWQAQDLHGAQLREELRRAAQVWDQHGRSEDYLWSGSAFRDYQLWRERYPGKLTELETKYGDAMASAAGKRQRSIRLAVAATFVVLLSVLAIIGYFWRESEIARQRSETAQRRSEAAKVLALGEAAMREDRTAALAYAIESLRLADTTEARRFAVRVLWNGPPAIVTPAGPALPWALRFSPDGSWLSVGYWGGTTQRVYPRDGGESLHFEGTGRLRFSDDGTIALARQGRAITVWSIPEWTIRRTIDSTRDAAWVSYFASSEDDILTIEANAQGQFPVRRWKPELAGEQLFSLSFERGSTTGVAVGLGLDLMAYGIGRELRVHHLDSPTETLMVGSHEDSFGPNGTPAIDRRGRFVVGGDNGGALRLWSLEHLGRPLRSMDIVASPLDTTLSPDGSILCVARSLNAEVWELEGVVGSEPILLPSPDGDQVSGCGLDPANDWATTLRGSRVSFWNLAAKRVRLLKGHDLGARSIVFSRDSRYLYSLGNNDGSVTRWPLDGSPGEDRTTIFESEKGWGWGLAIDPQGRSMVVTKRFGVWHLPLNGSAARKIHGVPQSLPGPEVIAPDGHRLLVNTFADALTPDLTIVNIDTEEQRALEPSEDVDGWGWDGRGNIIAVRGGRLESIDPDTEEVRILIDAGATGLLLPPHRDFAVTTVDGRAVIVDLASGATEPATWNMSIERRLNGFQGSAIGPDRSFAEISSDGSILAGYLDEKEPHLLYRLEGSTKLVEQVVISPDGRWVAATTFEGIYLWPMPAREEPPLHTLSHDDLMRRLESLTNIRAVVDATAPTGYRISVDDALYRGWYPAPDW